MLNIALTVFSISLLAIHVVFFFSGKSFALATPNSRKKHLLLTPQIGGLVFGPLFISICWFFNLAPYWYLTGGLISIILGLIDDLFQISWIIKLITQILIALFISIIFWEKFNNIVFYTLSISLSPTLLLILFLIWFVGIFNAVNLLDGLDGLASGFVFIISVGLGFSSISNIEEVSIIFSIILIAFLIFNQRPAKIFMGDSGSLFLGYHLAVIPLLSINVANSSDTLSMTPFIIIASYLIADTSRVFFTRIAAKKSPMTADTIHLHHLLLQQSKSYLSSIFVIYFIALISSIIAVISFKIDLSTNFMLAHFSLLLLFILVPPVNVYVPILVKIVKPFYTWNKKNSELNPTKFRTIFLGLLFLGLLLSIIQIFNFHLINNIQFYLSIIFLCLIIYNYRKDKISMYTIQVSLILFFGENLLNNQLNIEIKLFSLLIAVSYIVFTIEKKQGCSIRSLSSLDLLLSILVLGGIVVSYFNFPISFWFCTMIFSIWFGSSFIFRRTIYLNT